MRGKQGTTTHTTVYMLTPGEDTESNNTGGNLTNNTEQNNLGDVE